MSLYSKKTSDIILLVAVLLAASHFINISFLKKPVVDEEKLKGLYLTEEQVLNAGRNIAPITDSLISKLQKSSISSWDLRVGIFFDPYEAETFYSNLVSEGYNAMLLNDRNDGSYWVLIGPYKSEQAAAKFGMKLKDAGMQPVIVPHLNLLPLAPRK